MGLRKQKLCTMKIMWGVHIILILFHHLPIYTYIYWEKKSLFSSLHFVANIKSHQWFWFYSNSFFLFNIFHSQNGLCVNVCVCMWCILTYCQSLHSSTNSLDGIHIFCSCSFCVLICAEIFLIFQAKNDKKKKKKREKTSKEKLYVEAHI